MYWLVNSLNEPCFSGICFDFPSLQIILYVGRSFVRPGPVLSGQQPSLVEQKIQNRMKKSNFRDSDQLTHLDTFVIFLVQKSRFPLGD